MEFKIFKADLHIHSCLSPCGEIEMSPKRIIDKAREMKLDMIAIADHNSSENVQYAIKYAKEYPLIIPAMEVNTLEEIHILALFPELDNLLSFQKFVYNNLEGENDEDLFGMQIIADEEDNVLGFNKRMLIGATNIPIEDCIKKIHINKGLAIASHIDRDSFSVINQLGFIPPELKFDAVELSNKEDLDTYKFQLPIPLPIVFNSDAHRLSEIGRVYTKFYLKKADFAELKLALKNSKGRKIIYD